MSNYVAYLMGLVMGVILGMVVCAVSGHAQQLYSHPYDEPEELTPNERFERDTQQRALKGFLFEQMQRPKAPC